MTKLRQVMSQDACAVLPSRAMRVAGGEGPLTLLFSPETECVLIYILFCRYFIHIIFNLDVYIIVYIL